MFFDRYEIHINIQDFVNFMNGKWIICQSSYPQNYFEHIYSKNKIQLTPEIDVDKVLLKMAAKYAHMEVDTKDGVKIYIEKEWVHLRKSNTEPIIRVYSESENELKANELAERIIEEIKEII